jgi:hypothetical protein
LNIQWTATGLTQQNNSLGLAVYQTSLGSTRNILSRTVGNPVSNGQVSSSGSYNWTIPATAPSGTDYIVYLSNSSTYTQSNPFRIIPQNIIPTITVISPNGGEAWVQGPVNSLMIVWRANQISGTHVFLVPANSPGNGIGSLGAIGYVSSQFSNIYWDGKTVCSDLSTNNCSQSVPQGNYKIYLVGDVAGVSGQTVSDMSDNYFTLTSATIIKQVVPANPVNTSSNDYTSSNSYQSFAPKTSPVTAASTQSGWQTFWHFLGF